MLFNTVSLQSQLNAQTGSTKCVISPGVYSMNAGVTILKSGVYDFSGVVLQGIAKAGTLLTISADNTVLIQPTFDSVFPATLPDGKNPKIGVAGITYNAKYCILDHSRFRNIDQGIGAFPHSRYLTLLYPRFEPLECRGANIYCGGLDESIERGDIYWIGGYGKSEQEHPIRCSTSGFTGLYCTGVDFSATSGKESIAFRQGHNANFLRCTFTGLFATFVGEKTGDVNLCTDVTFEQCRFNGQPIDSRAVKNLNVIDNEFYPDIAPRTMGQEIQIVTGGNNVSQNVMIKGNRRYVATENPIGRKLRSMFQLVTPLFIDGGDNTDVLMHP